MIVLCAGRASFHLAVGAVLRTDGLDHRIALGDQGAGHGVVGSAGVHEVANRQRHATVAELFAQP